MGLWMTIVLMCSSPHIQSCVVITGNELITSKEQCFKVSNEKAREAVRHPAVYNAKPMCQQVPSEVLPEEVKKIDI
tara:strand:+ start:91 stop:318 length:228 start_codon:yes stop_codon:yes gene_type:complete